MHGRCGSARLAALGSMRGSLLDGRIVVRRMTRRLGWLAAIFVQLVVTPPPMVDAGGGGKGPPETLASRQFVSNEQIVESPFPIDFVGVVYERGGRGGAIRFRRGGRWEDWIPLEDDGVESPGQWASGLVDGADAEAFQVRVAGGARTAEAVVLNTTDGPMSAATTGCSDTSATVTRCEWGADESLMTWGTANFYLPQKLTVHHTATANGDQDPAATMRAIYRYQAVDRGFGDIGYHYLIDEAGRVYEGRHSGTDPYVAHDGNGNVVTAAHVGGFNSGNTGIALLGTLTSVDPTGSARSSLEQLLRELTSSQRIDPHGASEYVNPVNGTTKTLANISGHRDWAATECPGGALYALLPAIRDAVAGQPSPTDNVAPVISNVSVQSKQTTATVRWTTDEPSTGAVEYRRRGAATWQSQVSPGALVASHSVELSGLARRASYDYRIVGRDSSGNTTTVTGTFKTR